MKHQNKQRNLIRCLSIFALVFAIILTKTSCKKNDAIINEHVANKAANTKKFFNLPSNVSSAVARVANTLAKQNEKTGFINELANTAGYPVWGKSTVKLIKRETATNSNSLLDDYKGGDTCILIPMVLENGEYVNAFISATIVDDSVTMRLYYKNDYKTYPFKAAQPSTSITTAEAFATQMMLFDEAVFGYTAFEVKDKRLFHTGTSYSDTTGTKVEITINSSPSTGGGNNLIFCSETELSINFCTTPFAYQCINGCDNCGAPTCWTIILTQEDCTGNQMPEGGGWPSAPPGGPGGGGGGGGSNPPGGCQVGGLIENGFAPPNPCNGPGGGNPLPPVPPPPSTYNPCDTLNKYSQGNDFNVMLQDLRSKINTRREELYIFNNTLIPGSPITHHLGEENVFQVDAPNDNYFQNTWGFFHNHYADVDSASLIFSSGDMNIFSNIITDTAFFNVDYKHFMMGMVADSGANYILMVNNITQFRSWMASLSVFGIDNVFGGIYRIQKLTQENLPLSKAESERRFLKILAPSGLILFRGNNNATSWTPIKLDNTGTVIETNCL